VVTKTITLFRRIEQLSEEYGGLNKAAYALGINPGYLSRLASGQKTEPSPKVLAALGLRKAYVLAPKNLEN
jgi:hypothetical protein